MKCREESTQGRKGKREEKEEGETERREWSKMTCKIEMRSIKCEQERNRCEFLGTVGGNLLGKKLLIFLVDLKMLVIYDSTITLLGTEFKDILARVQQNTWSGMFLASLGEIAKLLEIS